MGKTHFSNNMGTTFSAQLLHDTYERAYFVNSLKIQNRKSNGKTSYCPPSHVKFKYVFSHAYLVNLSEF